MDIENLFSACKRGDLQRLEYYVDVKETEINQRDKWDSTPLYYACLCGHRDVVEFLLERGAKCEANTFDGERCLYGALNNEIKNLLKNYRVISTRQIKRDLFDEFLRKFIEDSLFSDIKFVIYGEELSLHRCILASRSAFFNDMLRTKWKDRTQIEINNLLMTPEAFSCIMQYLYTGKLEIPMEQIDIILKLAKQCQLLELVQHIERRVFKDKSLELSKPGVRVTTLVLEPALEDLKRDFLSLAEDGFPTDLASWIKGELPYDGYEMQRMFQDICFIVEGRRFFCHKAFFCGRSDYFKALLEDHFGENSSFEGLPDISLHGISIEVFMCIASYIYTDTCEPTLDIVSDVLMSADIYLLPGLKRLCGHSLIKWVDLHNVVPLVRTARLFNLPRLESHCSFFIASNITKIVECEEFHQLVIEDASNVAEREEADSIDIIDEVRYYITGFVQSISDMQEADEKLKLIDDLLLELDIEG